MDSDELKLDRLRFELNMSNGPSGFSLENDNCLKLPAVKLAGQRMGWGLQAQMYFWWCQLKYEMRQLLWFFADIMS